MAQYLSAIMPKDEESLIKKSNFSFDSKILDEVRPRRRSIDMGFMLKVDNDMKI